MADDTNTTTVDDFDDAPAATDEAPAGLGDAGKQALDRMKAERDQFRREAKANASAAKKLAEIEDRNKTEAQRLEERVTAAESRLGPVEQENARLRVALTKGLPADLVDRLRGGTEHELAADADKLLELVGQQSSGGSFDGGARRTAPPAGDMNSLIRQKAAARRGA